MGHLIITFSSPSVCVCVDVAQWILFNVEIRDVQGIFYLIAELYIILGDIWNVRMAYRIQFHEHSFNFECPFPLKHRLDTQSLIYPWV